MNVDPHGQSPPRWSIGGLWTPEVRLAAVSFLVLYLELAFIRWIPGYVHNFGYFTNFAMLAAFLGIGVGCLLAGRGKAMAIVPLTLLVLGLLVRFANLQIEVPSTSATAVFWSETTRPSGMMSAGRAVVLLFSLISVVFVGLGQPLGALFGELPRLRAYGLNVLGGLGGILVFAIHSHFSHPPVVWFATAVLLMAPFLPGSRGVRVIQGLLLAGFVGVVVQNTAGDTWGPYYRQSLVRDSNSLHLAGNGVEGIVIPDDYDSIAELDLYEVPYSKAVRSLRKAPEKPIHRALVIGCGAGNDVAMALRKGVEHVDAVDINPWAIEMGREHHPLHPFASERVTTSVGDGREFLARSNEPYDLIVYGLPDSTFTNSRANLRAESFIYTLEAFQRIRSRLSEDGVFVLYNYYRVSWLMEKIHGMLRRVFDQQPYLLMITEADGTPAPGLPVAMAIGPGLRLPPPLQGPTPEPATDDWPFLYLLGPSIPSTYLGAIGAVALLSLLAVLGALWFTSGGGAPVPVSRPLLTTLFFMGVAFVLLETRSVVTFGLFFGSTWWNNVVVFAAIHVSILLAVGVNAAFPRFPQSVMAALLFATLAFAWGLPPEALLVGSTSTRAVLAAAVAFSPIFCANVLFASIFKSASEGRVAYAFNLLGGMFGGLLEYVSLLVGYRALIGLAAVFYLLALLFAYRFSVGRGTRSPSPLAEEPSA